MSWSQLGFASAKTLIAEIVSYAARIKCHKAAAVV
jgi:hypothetical protein